ncbi:MAG: 16S rRNA (cytosine(967)-C(5))-methyltransferase RsmB [Pseudomonadota bacterium]
MSSGARLRATAARVITDVTTRGRSLDAALAQHESAAKGDGSGAAQRSDADAGRSRLRAICYGTLRFYPRLSAWLDVLLAKPLRKREALVRSLLLSGLHQLDAMRIAPHAVVAESVSACRVLGQHRASGLVNAVLRRFQRERDQLHAALEQEGASPELRYAHPAWLADAIRRSWPDEWPQVLEANNAHPPFWVRLNERHLDRAAFEAALRDSTGAAVVAAAPGLSGALRLDKPVDVHDLPGFDDGHVSVQDAAAQFAAPLLDARAGHRVLDACAAPGGKTGHILERVDGVELVALDSDARRLERVAATAERLGVTCEARQGRAEQPDDWWDSRPFDRILIDAPCSATGVIRRHPDIKVLRRADDIARLASGQLAICRALWPLLSPGGRLVYATCSILKEENVAVVQQFLDDHPDAAANWPENVAPPGRSAGIGRQVLPGEAGLDGFFYACIEKVR